MHLSIVILALSAARAIADLHTHALCVARGGDDFEATECACGLYRLRNTGIKPWDSCPDCFYNPISGVCHSKDGRIGGDEVMPLDYLRYYKYTANSCFPFVFKFEHYCSKRCGAQGSRAN
ncbi:hypothetical protein CDEST_05934 [Colletotrichum destructivum]|uniref:Uncharacterized protein n=1 Tax=Colletotrichum destructivum TaxID=34406 RepID=A0AAX4IC08_9PEZI|nr:hypothetical protein CDEST_05934 [Colletotrichum destructivum]